VRLRITRDACIWSMFWLIVCLVLRQDKHRIMAVPGKGKRMFLKGRIVQSTFWPFKIRSPQHTKTLCTNRPVTQHIPEARKPYRHPGRSLKHAMNILDFRFSPCSESCMFSFGYFPGVRLSSADVSEPSVRSFFKGLIKNILHQAFEDGPDRGFRNVGKT
jgi:hypothetical protein